MQPPTTSPRYWNPYVGGALLGLLLFLSFFITSNGPLIISTWTETTSTTCWRVMPTITT